MKRKLFFLLITLIPFSNVSYASFPVKEKMQDEHVQTNNNTKTEPERADKSARISLILTSVAALFVLFFSFSDSDLTSLGIAVIALLILTIASIFAIFGLFSKTNWWQSAITLIATSIVAGLLFLS